MSYGLERLKEIGAQKIHEKTHISRAHVQAVLHESFDGLNKIHFLGFISILEREYDVDLSDLKAKGLAYIKDSGNGSRNMSTTVYSQGKSKKSNALLYILLVSMLFGAFFYFEVLPSIDENNQIQIIDNSAIENAQKSIEPPIEITTVESNVSALNISESNLSEINVTSHTVSSETFQAESSKKNSNNEIKSLKILPKTKVWMGYIDIKTNQKYEKNIEKEMIIDASKNWLLLFGHGNINIDNNGVIQEFRSAQNKRFKYIDGNLSEISVEEFKLLNNDKKW